MNTPRLILLSLVALSAAVLAKDDPVELVPQLVATHHVYASAPGEFAKKPDARSFSYKVDGAALPDYGRDAAVKIRIRATDPDTTAVEVGFHQSDGTTWGSTGLPVSEDWQDVLLPFPEMTPFTHWQGHPPVGQGTLPDARRFNAVHFCFGRWLCASTLQKPHGFEIASIQLVRLPPGALGDGRDHSLDEFPAEAGEPDDTARLQRAVNASCDGTLTIPRGVYRVSAPIRVTNRCSLQLNKSAVLKAVAPMRYVLEVDARSFGSGVSHDYNKFVRGGVIDGNGLASCMRLTGFAHFTLADTTFLNGKTYGLRVDGGYELIANNLYFKCLMPGLAGNSAIYVNGGDSHYTDCVVVDYTYGIHQVAGGSNRYTRCHVWGGPLPPAKPGEDREMLKDSVNFKLAGGGSTILRDCYADTGKTGYEIAAWDTRLLGCSYFNNSGFKLDDVTIIRHPRGRLLVSECGFCKNMPKTRVYEGCGEVEWCNMSYSGFGPQDDCPGALKFRRKSAVDQSALKLAD